MLRDIACLERSALSRGNVMFFVLGKEWSRETVSLDEEIIGFRLLCIGVLVDITTLLLPCWC